MNFTEFPVPTITTIMLLKCDRRSDRLLCRLQDHFSFTDKNAERKAKHNTILKQKKIDLK